MHVSLCLVPAATIRFTGRFPALYVHLCLCVCVFLTSYYNMDLFTDSVRVKLCS